MFVTLLSLINVPSLQKFKNSSNAQTHLGSAQSSGRLVKHSNLQFKFNKKKILRGSLVIQNQI